MVTTRPPKTIVKPTALGPVANTDTKLLIYGLFQKGRVLAQDGVRPLAKSTMSATRVLTALESIPPARSCRLIRFRIFRCKSSFCHQSTSTVNGSTTSRAVQVLVSSRQNASRRWLEPDAPDRARKIVSGGALRRQNFSGRPDLVSRTSSSIE